MTTPNTFHDKPTWELPSPAKLNLMLHVVGRLPNGYHLLQTLFQLLDFGDTVTLTPNDTHTISLESDVSGVPTEENLIIRAARLLQSVTGCTKGVTLGVKKLIPMGAGLGGGSSNAATTLVGLNALWKTGLTLDELATLGLSLGADVPIFVKGHSAWAEGVGEKLVSVALPELWFLVIFPKVSVNTGVIFSDPDLTRNTPITTIRTALEGLGHNDCEPVVRQHYPEVDRALNWLNSHASAKLTGTGSCIYAAFPNHEAAQRVFSVLPDNVDGFVAKGVNLSPLHRILSTNNGTTATT